MPKSFVGGSHPLRRAVRHACLSQLEAIEGRLLLAVNAGTIPGDAKSGPAAKVGSGLGALFAEYQQFKASGASLGGFVSANSSFPLIGNSVVVDATADDPDQLAADLRNLNATNVAVAGHLVSAAVPIDSMDEMATLAGLRGARPAFVVSNTGSATSQGDQAKKTDQARANFSGVPGITGTGVTVGIL